MPQPETDLVVGAWLAKADADLGTTRTLLRAREESAPWVACFHAQQAAEKYLKAVLAAAGIQPPHVHNLVALQAQLEPALDLARDVDLAMLTTFATGPRYAFAEFPAEPELTWPDAQEALGWAAEVGRAARERLGGTNDKRMGTHGA